MIGRIKKIILKEGLNAGSFADKIGVQRSSLSHILNGRNNPSLDFVIKTLTHFPHISPEWLLLGKGDIFLDKPLEEKSDNKSAGAQDLFSSVAQISETEQQKPETDIMTEDIDNEPVNVQKPDRYVSQILIFYTDSTYQVFKQEK